MRQTLVWVCGFSAAVLLLGASGQPVGREILILNRGGEAIFWVAVGHAQTKTWSEDVLRFNDVIDVGEGKTVNLRLGQECLYDLRARYRDGDTVDLKDVNLCNASSVSFDH